MAEIVFAGIPASKGLALGYIWRPATGAACGEATQGDAALTGGDADALRKAIATAIGDLSQLEGTLSGEEAEIVGMQLAFLSDDRGRAIGCRCMDRGHECRNCYL
jgi:phosphotransferase system enzyme I (PtsI)